MIRKTTTQFAMVGPLIGGAVYFLPMAVLDQAWMRPSASPALLGVTALTVVFFSYFFGLIPAALTGAILGALHRNKPGLSWYTSAALVGLVTGAMCGMALDLYSAWHARSFLPISAAFFGVPSCISAIVCSCIFKPQGAGGPC